MQKNQLILPIHSLEIQQVSEFHDLKGYTPFLVTTTQKQVTTNVSGTP